MKIELEINSIPVSCNVHDFNNINGTNDVPGKIVRECFVYTKNDLPESTRMKNIDVTIIFGVCESSIERLLILPRFYNKLKVRSGQAKSFNKYVHDKYIKKGFEVCRTGSSSGLTTNLTDNFPLYYLSKCKYSTPRFTIEVMIIQKESCYEIIYITPYQKGKIC